MIVGHGSARLMLKPNIRQRLDTYVTVIRPLIANPEVDNVFVTPDGGRINKIQNIARFIESELKVTVPTATEVRKIGATKVARKCSESEARIVAKQMAHDSRVAAK